MAVHNRIVKVQKRNRALVRFDDDAERDAAVLGARVLVQSGEFAVCQSRALFSLDEAVTLYEKAEALLEDDEENVTDAPS